MRKKLLSILLVLSLMLALVPAAFAADAVRTELESDGTTLAFYGVRALPSARLLERRLDRRHARCTSGMRDPRRRRGMCWPAASTSSPLRGHRHSRYLRTYNGGLISIDGRQMLAAPNRCTAYEILDLVQTVKTGAFRYCPGLTAVAPRRASPPLRRRRSPAACRPDGCSAAGRPAETIGDFASQKRGCAAADERASIPEERHEHRRGRLHRLAQPRSRPSTAAAGTEAGVGPADQGRERAAGGRDRETSTRLHPPLRFLDGHWTRKLHDRSGQAHPGIQATDDGCGHTEENDTPARGHFCWGIGRVTTPPHGDHDRRAHLYPQGTHGCNATRTERRSPASPAVPVSERFDDAAPNSWAYEDIQYCASTMSSWPSVGGGRF
ncbi:MAG: hypothetical protein ACLSHG_00235 [Oscillospiraceae bacterium]